MHQIKKARRIISLLLSVIMLFSFHTVASAKAITTPYKSLPKETDVNEYVVEINGARNKVLSYRVFSQGGNAHVGNTLYVKKDYVTIHGCAVSSLTTVLSAHSKRYANYTPAKTYKRLEKKVFGVRSWKANYSKSKNRQMPVSLYGITKILNYCKIKAKYVRTFRDANAVKTIESHLKKGKPVIIEVNNHKQTNGRVYRAYNQKWATTKHTMVLLGMTDTGKVIVADSAYRTWSGSKQRIKFATMKNLVHYMIPSRTRSTSYYYQSASSNGGYVLVY